MKKFLILSLAILSMGVMYGCGRNDNPFYAMSDEQQSARKVVDEVQNIKQYAVNEQMKEMNTIEEKQ